MDRLSFVFSLLLIVSVTTITFGSVIKANNPHGESLEEPRSDPDLFPNMALKEFEALFKRFHHQSNPDMKTDAQAKLQEEGGEDEESEMTKRVDPEALIPGTIKLEDGSTKRHEVSIDIENHETKDEWTKVSMYYFKGKADTDPQPDVRPGNNVELKPYNNDGIVAGVLVYHIAGIQKSLAVCFSVFEYVNLWNVEIKEGLVPASERMFFDMLPTSQLADGKWHDGDLDSVDYRVSMSTSHEATLNIEIYDPKEKK